MPHYSFTDLNLALLHLDLIDDSDDAEDNGMAAYFMSEMSETVESDYRDLGFFQDEHGVFAPVDLTPVHAMADHIFELYNNTDDESRAEWDALGLHGDDDVDYNSGYVTTILSAIQALRDDPHLTLTVYLTAEFKRYGFDVKLTYEDDGEIVRAHFNGITMTHDGGGDWYTFRNEAGQNITIPKLVN